MRTRDIPNKPSNSNGATPAGSPSSNLSEKLISDYVDFLKDQEPGFELFFPRVATKSKPVQEPNKSN